MQTQKFQAADMAGAMSKVREALGADAVILSTSQLPNGSVEIEAASDSPREAVAAGAAVSAAQAAAANPGNAAIAALCRRVDSLSELVGRHLMQAEASFEFGARPEVAPWYSLLSDQEVDPIIIADLLDDISGGGDDIESRLLIRLKKLLKVLPPFQKTGKGPGVWALVGPTGVGKTTTCAKLAADFAIKKRLKVGMVNTDSYRLAAGDQLRAFGRIMEVPTMDAATPDELKRALQALSDRDLILVDTAGHAPDDHERGRELAELLAGAPKAVCHLVLACPTRDADQKTAAEAFALYGPASLIFCKMDETRVYGPVLNQVVRSGLPISFLAGGQKVPEDLQPANRESLARRILPER